MVQCSLVIVRIVCRGGYVLFPLAIHAMDTSHSRAEDVPPCMVAFVKAGFDRERHRYYDDRGQAPKPSPAFHSLRARDHLLPEAPKSSKGIDPMEVLKSGYKAASAAACPVPMTVLVGAEKGFSWPRRRRYRRALQATELLPVVADCVCGPGFFCTRRSTPKLGCISLRETQQLSSLQRGVPRLDSERLSAQVCGLVGLGTAFLFILVTQCPVFRTSKFLIDSWTGTTRISISRRCGK